MAKVSSSKIGKDMNKHFFRGALLVVALTTVHFAIQAIASFPTSISLVISSLFYIGMFIAAIVLWRKHHPWAAGFLAACIALYILPIVYLWLVVMTGGSIM